MIEHDNVISFKDFINSAPNDGIKYRKNLNPLNVAIFIHQELAILQLCYVKSW